MTSAGTLKKAEDVFYLEQRELWQTGADLKERVRKRRLLRERQKRLAPPPYIPQLSDASWVNDRDWQQFVSMLGNTVLKRGVQEHNGKKTIVGTPGSPGRARGIARVISGPDDFHRFEQGDVLVAHATTPVWTPLFNIASAIVTEVGGPFCHAAIVAREFGIPLVDGALDASMTGPTGARTAPPYLRLGSLQTGASGCFLLGNMSDVAVYDRVLTANQVATLALPWQFDQNASAQPRQLPAGRPRPNGAEDLSALLRCISWGVPKIAGNANYTSHYEIFQGPGYVVFLSEVNHEAHFPINLPDEYIGFRCCYPNKRPA